MGNTPSGVPDCAADHMWCRHFHTLNTWEQILTEKNYFKIVTEDKRVKVMECTQRVRIKNKVTWKQTNMWKTS